jgi:RNA polymerase sigma-70 factor, ECF subfamily
VRGRDGPPDKRLFRRARQGDRQAFGVLLRRYDERLRSLALRLVAEPDRIDAVLKRAYLRAWRSLPSVQVPGSVSEWLYRVVYNACINELRWAPEAATPEPVEGPRVPLPAASAKRRLAGLRALPPEERVPLVLIDAEGFTLDAASRILQKPPAEVAADLARARGRWRALVVGEPVRRSAAEVVELEPEEVEAASGESPRERPRHVRVLSSDTPPSPKRRPYRPRSLPSPRGVHAGGNGAAAEPQPGGEPLVDDEGSVEVVGDGDAGRGSPANGSAQTGRPNGRAGDGADEGDGADAQGGEVGVSGKGKRPKAT